MDLNNRYVVVHVLESVESVGWMKGGALAVLYQLSRHAADTKEAASALRRVQDAGLVIRRHGRFFLTEDGRRALGPMPSQPHHLRRHRATLDPQWWAHQYYLMFRKIIPDSI